jgi:hypothetical protein
MKGSVRWEAWPEWLRAFVLASAAFLAPSLPVSCGGRGATPANAPAAPAFDLDGDEVALLPPGAIVAATVDVRAACENREFGAQVSALANALLPHEVEVGLVPSRDVERVTFASYALQGADAVVVLRGRFDPAAIARAAGSVFAATPYSGRTLFTHGNVGFALLTSRTVLAGSGPGLRLALDRIRDGRTNPELAAPMRDTLRTKNVAAAIAADFTGAPLTALQGLPVPPWVGSVKGARGVATFQEPGVRVSGSLTFDDTSHAAAGILAVRQLASLIDAIAVSGAVPKLGNFTSGADGSDVQVGFTIDQASLRSVLAGLPQWLPSGTSSAAPNGAH